VRLEDDRISEWSKTIPQAINEDARHADFCFVIFSGDLTFSGKEEEFDLLEGFMKSLKGGIEKQGVNVHFLMSPGNHDCDFSNNCSVRDVVIERIIKDDAVNDESLINECIKVQKNYRNFEGKWCPDEFCTYKDDLVSRYCFDINGKKISFLSINASWMSRINEKQGEMVFPVDKYKGIFGEVGAYLNFCIMHHPLNWYSQGAYHEFRASLQRSFNGIFSGHEHVSLARRVSDVGGGDAVYFEASSLGPDDGAPPGFSTVVLDFDNSAFSLKKYELSDEGARIVDSRGGEFGGKKSQDLDFCSNFNDYLMDPGGSFKHPEKERITSEDLFVYPEVKRGADGEEVFFSSSSIDLVENRKIIFLGDDKSGKTFLLKRLLSDYHSLGFYPVILNASSIKSVSDAALEKEIKKSADKCYGGHELYQGLDKDKRVVLVDDVDRLPGPGKNKLKLLKWLNESFGHVTVTGSINLQLWEYLEEEVSEAFSEYSDYKLQDFGYRLRHELIKNWCACGDVDTKKDMDKRVHGLEGLINAVIGKNLVPARPIYLLILIQSNETHQHRELESASLAFYYQFLITKGLTECGWPKEQLNEIFNYLSHLAWFFRDCKSKELTEDQLLIFNDDFNDKYTRVDFSERLNLLLDAKILGFSHGCYSFLYPYVYYFFIGKYLSSQVGHDPEVKDIVIDMCKKLYRRENANSVLFLSHHAGDTWLADQILSVLSDCFSESKPIDFNGDTAALNELVESSSHVYLNSLDVDKHQFKKREAADQVSRVESDQDGYEDSEDDLSESKVLDFSVRMNLLFKTTEILGQIVKTYYGSIQRSKKKEYIEGVFNGPLRMLGFLFDEILGEPELFVKEIGKNISESKKGLDKKELDARAKKIAFDLIGMICTGAVARTAHFVDSDKINDDLAAVVKANPSNGFRLIQSGTGLLKPGAINYPALESLARDLKDNVFPFKILQTLVVNHIHMFHTSDYDKQKLSKIANITIADAKVVDFKSRSGKVLKYKK
jgi:hypothetical protein